MFSLIASAAGWLFGGSSGADKTIDSVSKGIDALVFTDEEKSSAKQAGFKLWIEYQKATQPQNVARRLIALVVTGLWALVLVLYLTLQPFFPEYTQFLFKLLIDIINPVFMLVMAFYFAKRIIRSE